MEFTKQISALEFYSKFKQTGENHNAIFGGRKALMDGIYATGFPIYCDQSYYVNEQKLDRVEKVGEHYRCSGHTAFEDWRDCHYYSLYTDAEGNKVWLMTGGRYD